MGRQCTVCTHPQLEAINVALIGGASFNDIISITDISKMALSRHMNNHLPATLVKAHDAKEIAKADALLLQVQGLYSKALTLLSKAEKAGELRTALQGIREAKGCLELLAKLQGQLQDEAKVVIDSTEVQAIVNQLVIVIKQEVDDAQVIQSIAGRLQRLE